MDPFNERFQAVALPLPASVAKLVREFASDKLNVHPVAQLIKELNFQYKPEENKYDWGIYLCERLEVSASQAQFKTLKEFCLTDFLPSYWSLYSGSFDEGVYEQDYMKKWLEDSDW